LIAGKSTGKGVLIILKVLAYFKGIDGCRRIHLKTRRLATVRIYKESTQAIRLQIVSHCLDYFNAWIQFSTRQVMYAARCA
jgi:hypothetical protein